MNTEEDGNKTKERTLMVKNIDSPRNLKNPFILKKVLEKYSIKINNAFISPRGALILKFDNEKNYVNALKHEYKSIFGDKAELILLNDNDENKLILLGIPDEVSVEDLKNELMLINIPTNNIQKLN